MLSSGASYGHAGLYKNLLQELAQKEGFRLPIYSTDKSGEAHMPIFVSQVEVEGELFTGQEAKSKKQAEMSAAKVAYMALKEGKGKSDQRSLFPLSVHQGQTHEFSSDGSEANVITGLQHHANPKSPVSPGLVNQNQPNKDKGEFSKSKETR
ncbi:Double-stranded RNA-binding protein 4, partial [Mucuna pruriens]